MQNAPRGPSWRRRFAPLLLFAAAGGIYLTVGPRLPHEQRVALDLGKSSPTITALELSWTDPRGKGDEPLQATRWNFAPGTAPARIEARVRLPDGTWNAGIEVERQGSPETKHWERRVDLGGGQVVLPLGEALP
jgi:hypothetical protein